MCSWKYRKKRRSLKHAGGALVLILMAPMVFASPIPQLPREEIPPDMPEEMRKQLDVLYDHPGDEEKCIAALTALGDMGAAAVPVTPFLASAIYMDGYSPSQNKTVDTLVQIGRAMDDPTPIIETVLVGLTTGGNRARSRALSILQALDARQAVPSIVAAMAGGFTFRNREDTFRDLAVFDYIEDLLEDERTELRRTAVQALLVMKAAKGEWLAEQLLKALDDEDVEVRQIAIEGLSRFSTPDRNGNQRLVVQMSDRILKSLQSEDPVIRRAAVFLAAHAEGGNFEDRIELLLPLMNDADELVQLAVVESLGQSTNSLAVETLARFVTHPDDQIRAAVAASLGNTRNRDACPLLEPLMDDAALSVREAALMAMVAVQGKEIAERLGQMLRIPDQDPMIVMRILMTLGEWGDSKNIGDVAEYVNHPDVSIWKTAVEIAVGLKDDGQDALLGAVLEGGDQNFRDFVADRLLKSFVPAPERIKRLLAGVADSTPGVRRNSLMLLAGSGCQVPDLGPIRKVLRDEDYVVRSSAIQILRNNKDRSNLSEIEKIAATDPSQRVAGAAVDMLFDAGDINGLNKARTHKDAQVAARATACLMRMDAAKVKAVLGEAAPVAEKQETIEEMLDEARAHVDDSRWLDALAKKLQARADVAFKRVVTLLDSEAAESRALGVALLGRMDHPQSVATIVSMLQDESDNVQAHAVVALGYKPCASALDALKGVAASDAWWLRERAVGSLAMHKNSEALTEVRRLLSDPDWRVRSSAGRALRAAADTESVPRLIEALGDEHWNVRRVALDALRSITRKDFGSNQDEWKQAFDGGADK